MTPTELLDFHRLLGVQSIEIENGTSRVSVKVADTIGNRRGNVHGGALAAFMDIAMSRAIHSAVPELVGMATISMTINYMLPAVGDLTVHAEVTRAGGSIAVAQASSKNADGSVSANASGVFRIVRQKNS